MTDYQEMADRVSRLSISESSPDGAITVTVSASGVLTGLQFLPEPELAAEIMACVQQAQARIPDLLREAIFDTIGAQDPSTHLLLDEARRRFPSQDPPPPRKPTEDWSERDVLEDV